MNRPDDPYTLHRPWQARVRDWSTNRFTRLSFDSTLLFDLGSHALIEIHWLNLCGAKAAADGDEEGRYSQANQRRGLRIRDWQGGCYGFSDHPEHAHFSRFGSSSAPFECSESILTLNSFNNLLCHKEFQSYSISFWIFSYWFWFGWIVCCRRGFRWDGAPGSDFSGD